MDQSIIYLNGKFVPESEARVSVLDRGFTSGEGVYDVTRTFRHKPFKLREHCLRLYRSMRYTRIDCGFDVDEMERITLETFERNRKFLGPDDDFSIWQVLTRGVVQSTIGNKAKPQTTVAIFCVPTDFSGFARHYLEGAILVTPSTRRIPPQCLESKAKITNKVNHLVAALEAKQVNPAAIPLMLDVDGNIAEANTANFFFVSGGKLHTPTDRNCLSGITRETVFELAKQIGVPFAEGNYTPYDVYNADEAFLSGTSSTISPVRSLDGVAVKAGVPGPITVALINAFNRRVGIDIVDQALTHLDGRDKQQLLGTWSKLKAA